VKKEVLFFFGLLFLVLAVFIGAVRYMAVRSSPLKTNADTEVKDLHFSLKMDNAVYRADEPVILKLGVRNVGEKPVVIEFPSSLESDFVVERERDFFFFKVPFEVWRYSAQGGEVDNPHKIAIKAGEEKIFQAKWNQNDFNGKQVQPGKYRITGIMNTKNFKISLQLRGETEK